LEDITSANNLKNTEFKTDKKWLKNQTQELILINLIFSEFWAQIYGFFLKSRGFIKWNKIHDAGEEGYILTNFRGRVGLFRPLLLKKVKNLYTKINVFSIVFSGLFETGGSLNSKNS
jgi:hypothetical protein